jgi:hypothetical protein
LFGIWNKGRDEPGAVYKEVWKLDMGREKEKLQGNKVGGSGFLQDFGIRDTMRRLLSSP